MTDRFDLRFDTRLWLESSIVGDLPVLVTELCS